eukprot:1292440-Rhodomonas_salina.3
MAEMLRGALLKLQMIPTAVETGALWMHPLQTRTMVLMSQNCWMIRLRGYSQSCQLPCWTAQCSAFPSMVWMSLRLALLGGGVFSVDDPATRPPIMMLPLAQAVRTGTRARVLAEEESFSSGLMMLMDCVEDELSMVESGLDYPGTQDATRQPLC